MTEDEMVGWHHRLNGHEFEQTLGVGDGQEAWRAAVHGVAKRWTQLNNFHFHFNPEYSLEGLMLKHQYFGHLMPRAYSPEKT